jgi:hypothetical protein
VWLGFLFWMVVVQIKSNMVRIFVIFTKWTSFNHMNFSLKQLLKVTAKYRQVVKHILCSHLIISSLIFATNTSFTADIYRPAVWLTQMNYVDWPYFYREMKFNL